MSNRISISAVLWVALLSLWCVLLVSFAQTYGAIRAILAILLLPLGLLLVPSGTRRALMLLSALRQQFSWWHIPLALLFCSDLVFRLRTAGDIRENTLDAWAGYRVGLVAIAGMVLLFRLALGSRWPNRLFTGRVGWLFLYAILCALSTLWSSFPAWSFYKSVEYMVDVAFIAAILASVNTEEGWRALFNWNYGLHALLAATVWVEAAVWPRVAFEPSSGVLSASLSGVMPSVAANGVGELGAVVAVVALARLLTRGREHSGAGFYAFLLAGGLLTIVVSQTRSAVLGFVVGAALIFIFAKRVRMMVALLALVIPLLLFTSLGSLNEAFLRRGQSNEQVQDLSGRVGWWRVGWQIYTQHPLTGTGAYTARFEVLDKLGESDTSSIHSTYLETLVGLGPLGLVFIIAALLGTWRGLLRAVRSRAIGTPENSIALECMAVLAVITVRSFFTVEIVWHPPLMFMVALGYAEFRRRRRVAVQEWSPDGTVSSEVPAYGH